MCEQGPIANTDQSQTNFLLILHTFLPMRVTCYRTKHAAICTCKDWIGRSDASLDKDCGNRHADQRSEFSPFEWRPIGQKWQSMPFPFLCQVRRPIRVQRARLVTLHLAPHLTSRSCPLIPAHL